MSNKKTIFMFVSLLLFAVLLVPVTAQVLTNQVPEIDLIQHMPVSGYETEVNELPTASLLQDSERNERGLNEEVVAKRTLFSKTYYVGERQFQWCGSIGPIHYQDKAGMFHNIDMRLKYKKDKMSDGWAVNKNSWHFFLGRMEKNGADGWMSFKPQQIKHEFSFRLARVGYYHMLTGTLEEIAGVPDYDRNNIAFDERFRTIGPRDEELCVQSVIEWKDLWTMPGGGSITGIWEISGKGIKEKIVIDQQARAYINANKQCASSDEEMLFGFYFEISGNSIIEKSTLKDVDFIVATTAGEMIGAMPVDYAIAGEELLSRQVITKYFWSKNEKTFLFIGIPVAALSQLPAGDLMFDPTINEQVGVNTDDGYSDDPTDNWRVNGWFGDIECGGNPGAPSSFQGGVRFQTVAIPQGANIVSTTFQGWGAGQSGTVTNVHLKIVGNDTDDAAVWSAPAEIPQNMAQTVAQIDYDPAAWPLGQWNALPGVTTIIQEIINRAGWVSDNSLKLALIDDGCVGGGEVRIDLADYSSDITHGAKLDITYTSSSTETDFIFEGAELEGVSIE